METLWKRYKENEDGNFAIMFSVFMGILFLGVAVVIESARMYSNYGTLQDMADSAALSGAYIANTDPAGREDSVRESIRVHQAYIPDLGLATNAVVEFNDETEEVSVVIPRTFRSFFGGILGTKNLMVSSKSIVSYKSEAVDPLSIVFALDVSGSMREKTDIGAVKIDVLKQSVTLLFEELEESTPRPDLLDDALRTGMSAYNTEIVSEQPISKGWKHLRGSVDNLVAAGGTNSTPALQSAYDQLTYDRTVRTSQNPKFDVNDLREYVVFMTDGVNNQPIWNEESTQLCETMRAEGIQIYSIAFAAPELGQLLLIDCASWNTGAPPEDLEEDEALDALDVTDASYDVDSKCLNNGAKGKGKALGHCKDKKDKKEKKRASKSNYYFDADDAEAFKNAFVLIGQEIAQNTIRVKG